MRKSLLIAVGVTAVFYLPLAVVLWWLSGLGVNEAEDGILSVLRDTLELSAVILGIVGLVLLLGLYAYYKRWRRSALILQLACAAVVVLSGGLVLKLMMAGLPQRSGIIVPLLWLFFVAPYLALIYIAGKRNREEV